MTRDTQVQPAREGEALESHHGEMIEGLRSSSALATDISLPLLFTPIRLAGLTAHSRIVVSPMCQYLSQDGGPTDWHLVHLGRFALGGAGIIFCEETAVEERGRKTYGCAGIYAPRHVQMYRRITDFLRENGAIPAMQLGHAGRKASCGPPWTHFRPLTDEDAKQGKAPWLGIAPSPIPSRKDALTPLELSSDEIRTVIAAWQEAALRTLDAGYEILEIHGAHGYLIHQFLSPLSNHRRDEWGGDLSGRMRFALEVTEAVRYVWPKDRPLFFRVSAIDGENGAWKESDTVALAKELKLRGVDVIDCSSGGISGPHNIAVVPRQPGFQVPYSDRVKREAQISTMAVGLISSARQAEDILQSGRADLIALARELLYDPHWPVHAAKELNVPDYLNLLSAAHGWWLKRREQILAAS